MSRLRKITQEELNKILEEHQLWLDSDGIDGHQANLSHMDLKHIDLSYANLEYADLSFSDLRHINLSNANLRYTDLKYVDLRGASLFGVDLRLADLNHADLEDVSFRNANLRSVDMAYANLKNIKLNFINLENADFKFSNLKNASLIRADLRKADLRFSNLYNANIIGADLYGANLTDTNIIRIKHDLTTKYFSLACPEQGEFIGYKKVWGKKDNEKIEVIVELLILPDAKRSSATTRQCRCSKAKVLSITDLDGNDISITEAFSKYDNSFIYKSGEIVEVDNFNENRWIECTTGIHFFMDREMSVEYKW